MQKTCAKFIVENDIVWQRPWFSSIALTPVSRYIQYLNTSQNPLSTHHHLPVYPVHLILLLALLELPLLSTLVGPKTDKLRIVIIAFVQIHDALCLCWALTIERSLSVLHGEVLYVL